MLKSTRYGKTGAKHAEVNAHVSGIVLNGISAGKSGYYSYGYYSDYNSLPKLTPSTAEPFTNLTPEMPTEAQLAKYIHTSRKSSLKSNW